MGTESSHGFEGTPLGKFAAERTAADATVPESHHEDAIATEMNGETVKIYPKDDGSFHVYIDTCSFSVEKTKLGLEAKNITPAENQGGWRANRLQPLALQAVEENYFKK